MRIPNSISLLCILSLPVATCAQWSLDDCIQHAKAHNVEVAKQKIRNEILKKDIKTAWGNYLPNAHFSASQNYTLGSSFNVSTSVGQRESRSNNFSLSSNLTVFNGFSNRYKLQKSKLSAEKGAVDLDRIQFDLALYITNKYLLVLFNKEILKVAKEQIKISQTNFKRLQRLYKDGLIGKGELLEIESALASDKKGMLAAQNNVDKSLIELRELLDVKPIENFDIQELKMEPADGLQIENSPVSDRIIEENPFVKTARFSMDIKKKDIRIAGADFYPKVSLNYSFGSNYFHVLGQEDVVRDQKTNQLVENGFWTQLRNNSTHYVGLSVTIPIFNRFMTMENYKKSREALKIAAIELENNKQQLENKIEIARNDVKTAKETLKASQAAFLTQQEAFYIVQEKYKNGNIPSYEFLESKSKLTKNTSEYIKTKFDLLFKKKILEYYLLH